MSKIIYRRTVERQHGISRLVVGKNFILVSFEEFEFKGERFILLINNDKLSKKTELF